MTQTRERESPKVPENLADEACQLPITTAKISQNIQQPAIKSFTKCSSFPRSERNLHQWFTYLATPPADVREALW